MKKILIGCLLILYSLPAMSEITYKLEHLREMVKNNQFPEKREFELSDKIELSSMNECKKILQEKMKGAYSKYPITIDVDIPNKFYEITAWKEYKAQKAICEKSNDIVTAIQLDALYTYNGSL